MIWVVLFLALMGTIGLAGRAHWRDPRPSPRPQPPVPESLATALGPALSAWLGQTRELYSAAEALQRYAREMLDEEHARRRRRRPRDLDRRVDDANFLVRIREVRELAERWRDDARAQEPLLAALPDPIVLRWDELDPALELPWGLTVDHDRKADRSDEIERITCSTRTLVDTLGDVDQTLTANRTGYR